MCIRDRFGIAPDFWFSGAVAVVGAVVLVGLGLRRSNAAPASLATAAGGTDAPAVGATAGDVTTAGAPEGDSFPASTGVH